MPQLTDAQTATLEVFLRHLQEQPRSVGLDQDGAERWQALLAKTAESVQAVAVELDAILNDPKLSDAGKQTKLMAVGPNRVGDFKNMGQVLKEADAAKARLETVLFGPILERPKGDAVIQFLREQEIRTQLGTAASNERGAAFLLALEADQMETARALLDAPGSGWVTDEVRQRGQDAYGKRTK